jgi:hypothetical protein
MGLADLIAGCAARDPDRWSKLWRLIEGIAWGPIQRLLRQHRFDKALADDLLQELYLYLQTESARRLRLFRGTTEPQFRAYIRVTATRFANKMILRWRRARYHESKAARAVFHAAVTKGPTDSQIRLAIGELLPLLPPADYHKLQNVADYSEPVGNGGTASARGVVPPRTARRWRSELLHKYAELV